MDAGSGELELLNSLPSGGADPCFVTVTHTREVLCANYSGGSVAYFRTSFDGKLEARTCVVQFHGSGPNAQRQGAAHPHQIVPDSGSEVFYVPDLGSDVIRRLRLRTADGQFEEMESLSFTSLLPGGGPRHIVLHPSQRVAYCLHELKNMVSVLCLSKSQAPSVLQQVPTLPEDFAGENLAADIHVAPNGRFLYVSNRGHDSIAIYSIDQGTGQVS